MSYFSKYQKYKKKYFDLKYGGAAVADVIIPVGTSVKVSSVLKPCIDGKCGTIVSYDQKKKIYTVLTIIIQFHLHDCVIEQEKKIIPIIYYRRE